MFLQHLLLCTTLAASALAFTPGELKTRGQPWPMPQQYSPSPTVLTLSPHFQFTVSGKDCDILRSAINRYEKIIRYHLGQKKIKIAQDDHPFVVRFSSTTMLSELRVDLMSECEQWPYLGMDESYDLAVTLAGSLLNSKSIWGILRGLETFSQLIYTGDDGTQQLNETRMHDYPLFSHRGVMLDTSRHFVHKDILLKNLAAMAYDKFNVFHWHIVDDQSFPYQSAMFPELSNKGAYDPVTHIYTQEDIAEIIEFARMRGIRVIPEFDTPGHSESWGHGQPGLLTPCCDKSGSFDGSYGPIDPSRNSTFSFLTQFVKELTTVFKDHYLHLGGDEVSFSCWKSNPNITAFMKNMSLGTDYAKLESYYIQNLLNIVASYKAGYVVWQEVFDNHVSIKSDTVVHVWKGGYQKEMSEVTAAGYHALLSSPWYLNYISYGHDWTKYYSVDPLNFNGTEAQKSLVLGGEVCLWGEYVDGTNLRSRLWPRASAVAERLWSSVKQPDSNSAGPRLEEHRCRLISRGVPAEPVNGPGFCEYEYQDLLL